MFPTCFGDRRKEIPKNLHFISNTHLPHFLEDSRIFDQTQQNLLVEQHMLPKVISDPPFYLSEIKSPTANKYAKNRKDIILQSIYSRILIIYA